MDPRLIAAQFEQLKTFQTQLLHLDVNPGVLVVLWKGMEQVCEHLVAHAEQDCLRWRSATMGDGVELAEVDASWAEPVAKLLGMEGVTLPPQISQDYVARTLRGMMAELPRLYREMDREALATAFDGGMARAAVGAVARSRLASVLAKPTEALAAEAVLAPWDEAVRSLGGRKVVAARLDSAEWAKVPAAIRRRSFFSAKVESAEFLQQARNRLEERLSLAEQAARDGKTQLVSRDTFIRDMRGIAQNLGVDTAGNDPSAWGGLRDIRSNPRLGLIYDMNLDQAAGHAKLRADLDPLVLDRYPAFEFARIEPRVNERKNWPDRWDRAAGEVGRVGVADGAMVALKTSPIWEALSVFGTPWPPYDWGSGMGQVDVDRETAIGLGLLADGAALEAGSIPDLNDGLETSVMLMAPEILAELVKDLGSTAKVVSGMLKLI